MDSENALTIVHVLEPGGGGTMRHVLDLAQYQAMHGHRVHIIYSRARLEPLFAPQLEQLQHVTLHELPMRRAPHPGDIGNLIALIKILRGIDADIVHAHSTKAGLLARMAGIFIRARIIYTPHALMTLDPATSIFKKFVYGLYERILSLPMQRMIVLSSFEHDHARALGLPASKLVMGRNGMSALPVTDRAAIRREWQCTADDVVMGWVGRFAHQKNPELAIRAFAHARADNAHARLVMIGDGELLDSCRELAETLGVASHIIWLGAADARQYYSGMDLLLVTSHYEGMAYTFIEALFAGLPIVTTAVGGSDSCVIEGQTGFITAPNADHMAAAILRVADDAAMRDAMRFASRAHARRFTLENMYQLHQEIYR